MRSGSHYSTGMTIDEKLKVLAEHVDTLTGMQIESERRIQELLAVSAQLERSMVRLVNIAVSHEDRLDDHDQRLEKLEGNPAH